MSDDPRTYVQACSMEPGQADRVAQMLTVHREFGVEMKVNPDRTTFSPEQARLIPEGSVMVTFTIRPNDCMPDFYREVDRAMNMNSPAAVKRERER